MGRQFLIVILPILTGIAWSTSAAPVSLTVVPETLRVGEQAILTWTDATGTPITDAHALVVYRPGSLVSKTEPIGKLSEQGGLAWRPKVGGLVRLRVEGADGTVAIRDVSVRFAGVPIAGILVFVAAGTILVGGFLAGFFRRPKVE